MSEPMPACSCRLPWIVAVIALGIVATERIVAATAVPSTTANEAPVADRAPATPPADPRLAGLQHDLSETRRVLDDAQSALAQRDREIATANDELRVLRQELETLRAKPAVPAP